MKHGVGVWALMAFSPLALSDNIMPEIIQPLVLDKVLFQVSAKQWVSTQTALLSVTINVSLNSADLVKARADIMTRLNKIAKGDWHLLQFDRSQDSSGLEKLYVQAQSRVDQEALTTIYQNAKSVSAPGARYDITGIEFKPSLEETQGVRATIREKLYQQINDELSRMNKAYSTQNYSVSSVVFVDGDNVQPPQASYRDKTLNTMVMASASAPSVAVSNELVITALVEAASNRKQVN